MTHKYLLCYRWRPSADHADPEVIWEFVQRHQGHIEQLRDTVDFYIPDHYQSLLLLKFPSLNHIPALDYLV